MKNAPSISRRRLIQLTACGPVLLAGRAAAAPVDESGFVRIGGIEQWISIEGGDAGNPAILYLHGGPGEALSPFLKQFLPWERDFTVANWDQRGAGKTYGRNGAATPDMTLDRMIDDAIEVAENLRGRLKQRKLILVGQSWGSLLGVHVIKNRPDLFHAFVGTGQFVSLAAMMPARIEWSRQAAKAAGDQDTLKALDGLSAVPEEHRILAVASVTNKWAMAPADLGFSKMIRDFGASGSGDAADWSAGADFSGSKLALAAVIPADLREAGLEMPIPFFVIQGRDDHVTPFETAKAYVEEVRAPVKAFVAIDDGHYACFTHADQFAAALRKYVRPLAI